MLKAALRKAIEDVLTSAAGFTSDDFVVVEGTDARGRETLTIGYRFKEQYEFRSTIPKGRTARSSGDMDFIFEMTMSPGEIGDSETKTVAGQKGLLSAIRDWVGYVTEELAALPTNRQVAEQRAQIEEILAQVQALPDELFTRDEASSMLERLVDLEGRLTDHITKTIQDEKKAAVKTKALERDFQVLRSQMESLTKRGWARSLAVRAAQWLRDPVNRDLLKSGAEVARVLLPGGEGTNRQ